MNVNVDTNDDECVFFRHKLTALQLVLAEKACSTEHRSRIRADGADACSDFLYANLQRLWTRCAHEEDLTRRGRVQQQQ